MNSLSALVVDDEPAARRDLVEVLGAIEDVRIVAQASDAAAARQLAKRHRPDLIFMDIQLPGADGFSALEDIDITRSCVIFTTAYSQYALRAFEFGATDYLLKPVEEGRCRRAIERARETLRRPLEATDGPVLEIEEHVRPERLADLLLEDHLEGHDGDGVEASALPRKHGREGLLQLLVLPQLPVELRDRREDDLGGPGFVDSHV